MECPGKALQTMVGGVFLLVVGRNRTAVRVVQAKLGERNVVKDCRLGELASRNRQQQRLHGQSIDRDRADQPSPEQSQPRTCLIWPASHAHKRLIRAELIDAPPNRHGQYSKRGMCGKPSGQGARGCKFEKKTG